MADDPITDFDKLQEVLREKLKTAELSYEKIAAKTELSKTHLVHFAQGSRGMSYDKIKALAKYFGVRFALTDD